MARSSSITVVRASRSSLQRQGNPQPLPKTIAPMLAALSGLPPDDSNWGFEYKWDGVRAIAFWDGKRLRLQSRNLLDITPRYPELSGLGRALGRGQAILDGEIVALDQQGRPSFALLQHRMHVQNPNDVRRLTRQYPVWYMLFDVLWADGGSTMDMPYSKRRRILEGLGLAGPAWQITPAHVGDGKAMLEAARLNHLEGVVAKRLNSIYEPGRRSPSWLKIKVIFGQEVVIGGWVPEKGVNRARVGTLLVGYYDCDGKLRYAGGVGTGFNAELHRSLTQLLSQRTIPRSPFADSVSKKDAIYVRPDLVAEVEYRRWPVGGMIQQASFKGLRTDKPATDVVREGQGCSPQR